MPKVAVYTRATTGGSRRRYVKATRGSDGDWNNNLLSLPQCLG